MTYTSTLHLGGGIYAHPDLEPLLTDTRHLNPHPRNPRNGDTDTIATSITTNGLYRPIYAQRGTGHILAGNHTYAAALELGAERLPVVWLDVTDEDAERIMLVDNKAADLGWYDNALLLDLLADITATDTGLLGTAYTDDDLERLIAATRDDTPMFTPEGDLARLDQSIIRTCPYCHAHWRDTAAGPERMPDETG